MQHRARPPAGDVLWLKMSERDLSPRFERGEAMRVQDVMTQGAGPQAPVPTGCGSRAASGAMIRVGFRFYGVLNDFLPRHRHQRRFIWATAATTSVKDAIEALGVPHPEVDVIVVNGTPEVFAYRLRDGDNVSVYPLFRSIDVAGIRRVGGVPPRPIRFVVDAHLSKLASLLRLCGFDALVVAGGAEVAELATRDGRVALTRDVAVLKRGGIRHGYFVRRTDPEGQLVEILERFDLIEGMEPFTRCLRCNTAVVVADLEAVADRLPPRTRAIVRQVHHCPGCGRLYWHGSHYSRLAALVERARHRAPHATAPGSPASDRVGS